VPVRFATVRNGARQDNSVSVFPVLGKSAVVRCPGQCRDLLVFGGV